MSHDTTLKEDDGAFIAESRTARDKVQRLLRARDSSIALAAIILVLLFSVTSGGQFLHAGIWPSILSSTAELGIVSIGVAVLMIGGDFDLSVGANFSFAALVMASLIAHGVSGLLGLAVALSIGLAIGFLNGMITVYLAIPSFVATLGTWLVWVGVTLVVTGGSTVTVLRQSRVLNALGGSVFGAGIRWEVIWWILLGAVMAVVLHRTAFGNAIFAIGGRSQAAREAGIPVRRVRVLNFMICGLCSAAAGAVQLGHLQSMASSYGDYYQLYSIAAAVVGGTVLTGGRGSVFGTMLGALILSMLDAGLILSGVSTFWYQAVVGIIVILAVAMHTRLGRTARGGD
ncbi:MAG: ABC transporter permease [Thermaerobacter sp.]|nr:ABC transporter permease [Thermaerobacter sp.]